MEGVGCDTSRDRTLCVFHGPSRVYSEGLGMRTDVLEIQTVLDWTDLQKCSERRLLVTVPYLSEQSLLWNTPFVIFVIRN